MREIGGKGCLGLISLIFGIFIGNEFYWVAGFPQLVANVISLVSAIAIAWFLIGAATPKRQFEKPPGSADIDWLRRQLKGIK